MTSDEALTRTLAAPEFPLDSLSDQVEPGLTLNQETIDPDNGLRREW